MDRELLAAGSGRASEEDGLALTAYLAQEVEDGAVVQVGVVVVHPLRVRAVVPSDVPNRDALTEVGLEAVHAHLQQPGELGAVPGDGVGVGEVDQRHASLPQVGLPDVPVGLAYQVPLGRALGEQCRALGDVGVDPHADLQSLGLHPLEHGGRVWEGGRVPLEVRPVETTHPEAVEVEDAQRQVALRHPVDEAGDGFLVVGGGERGRQPQTEGPGRHHRGPAGQGRVAAQHVLGGGTVNDVVGQALAVLVPDVHALAVLGQGPEALTQAVDTLARTQAQLLTHVGLAVWSDDVGHRPRQRGGQLLAGVGEASGPVRPFLQVHSQVPGAQGQSRALGLDDSGVARLARHLEVRPGVTPAGVVDQRDLDDAVRHGGEGGREQGVVEGVAASGDRADRGVGAQGSGAVVRGRSQVQQTTSLLDLVALAVEPVSVRELHVGSLDQ